MSKARGDDGDIFDSFLVDPYCDGVECCYGGCLKEAIYVRYEGVR